MKIGSMKRILIILFLILMVTSAGSAEDAILIFSSFDGDGPEYRITTADPDIISCTRSSEYDDPRHEDLFFASYTVTFTIKGLIPGNTILTVTAVSPTGGEHTIEYEAEVDHDLNVTLTRIGDLSRFRLYRGGEFMPQSYQFYRIGEEYYLYKDESDDPILLDPLIVEELTGIMDRYGLLLWDGFDETMDYVLDGEGFDFSAGFTNGVSIEASGDNAFPDFYFEAAGQMEKLLEAADGDPVRIDAPGTYIYEGDGFGGDFTITLEEDGDYGFSEGPLSSYLGEGAWLFEKGKLYLIEFGSLDLLNCFAVGNGLLIFIEKDSDNFPYVHLSDGAKFIKQ